jgi:hypothetical protein
MALGKFLFAGFKPTVISLGNTNPLGNICLLKTIAEAQHAHDLGGRHRGQSFVRNYPGINMPKKE